MGGEPRKAILFESTVSSPHSHYDSSSCSEWWPVPTIISPSEVLTNFERHPETNTNTKGGLVEDP